MRISTETVEELAQRLGFKGDLAELRMGLEEEYREHAKTLNYSLELAARIAIDHLTEEPYYYTKMEEMKRLDYRLRNNRKEG
jgi:hypothetical protein